MADFVAVLRKTIDGLGETTPEMRARVYDKARGTISAKLAAMNPPPSPAVVERQKKVLEDAIAALEAEYVAAAQQAEPDDLDEVMEQLSRPEPLKPANAAAASQPASPARPDAGVLARQSVAETQRSQPARPVRAKSGGARGARIAVALIALAFAGSAAYAVWLNKDEVSAMLGLGGEPAVAEAPAQPPAPEEPAETQEVAAAPAPEPAPAEEAPPPKFTQKLNEDGSETDPGPAGGEDTLGEGTSVAAVTTPPPATPVAATDAPQQPAAPADATPATDTAAAPAETTPPAPAEQAVAVGQRAIFYEERTSADQQTAEQGNIVWSLVQESPGNDLPPEAAIRAEASIPGKDIQLRMTIRRNADETLPASHIVELIFLTPETFEGGAIDNVLRMTMKETEEATGNPLLGIPAKIGDGFFLIALSDGAPELEANLQLLRRMRWIDVPVVYRNGRRALMTMERGIPGDKVFEEALKDWATKSG